MKGLNIKISNWTLFIIFILFFISCNKKEVGPQYLDSKKAPDNNQILILNEGNFGFGNASISVYNSQSKEVSNNAFKAINGFGVGDVLQSYEKHNDKYYFVINNSGKVIVTDTNLVYEAEITGFNSPRYFVAQGNKAYVSDLKQNAIYVVDLITNQIIKQIKTVGWTESLIIHNYKLYAIDRGGYLSNAGNNKIYVIDIVSNTIMDSIAVSLDPNSMQIDKYNKLWVLCSGGINIVKPNLLRIDLNSNSIEKTFTFTDISMSPTHLKINRDGEELFFINNSVYKMNVMDSVLSTTEIIKNNMSTFYGLGIDNTTKDIYTTDALDYIQIGVVRHFNERGTLLKSFNTGIIPQFVN